MFDALVNVIWVFAQVLLVGLLLTALWLGATLLASGLLFKLIFIAGIAFILFILAFIRS